MQTQCDKLSPVTAQANATTVMKWFQLLENSEQFQTCANTWVYQPTMYTVVY